MCHLLDDVQHHHHFVECPVMVIGQDHRVAQINHECVGAPPSNSPKCDSTITSLVDKHIAYEKHGDGSARLMEDETVQIDLLSILQCAQAPLYLYQEVWKWAQSLYDHKVSF